jgi:hypothetical protein
MNAGKFLAQTSFNIGWNGFRIDNRVEDSLEICLFHSIAKDLLQSLGVGFAEEAIDRSRGIDVRQ